MRILEIRIESCFERKQNRRRKEGRREEGKKEEGKEGRKEKERMKRKANERNVDKTQWYQPSLKHFSQAFKITHIIKLVERPQSH